MYIPFGSSYLNTAMVAAFSINVSVTENSQYIEATLANGKTIAWHFDSLQECQNTFEALGRELMTSYGSPG